MNKAKVAASSGTVAHVRLAVQNSGPFAGAHGGVRLRLTLINIAAIGRPRIPNTPATV